ncbi:MAG: SsgA family sporulation/cell division regulator [Mycobacteriales bacterium]
MTFKEPACHTLLARLHSPAADGYDAEPPSGFESTLVRVAPLTLCYDPSQPFEVRLIFDAHCDHELDDAVPDPDAVTWYTSRELITAGLSGTAGIGDISLAPASNHPTDRDWLILSLRNGRTATSMRLPRAEVRQFVHAVWELVPVGTELDGIDFEAELALLLLASRG